MRAAETTTSKLILSFLLYPLSESDGAHASSLSSGRRRSRRLLAGACRRQTYACTRTPLPTHLTSSSGGWGKDKEGSEGRSPERQTERHPLCIISANLSLTLDPARVELSARMQVSCLFSKHGRPSGHRMPAAVLNAACLPSSLRARARVQAFRHSITGDQRTPALFRRACQRCGSPEDVPGSDSFRYGLPPQKGSTTQYNQESDGILGRKEKECRRENETTEAGNGQPGQTGLEGYWSSVRSHQTPNAPNPRRGGLVGKVHGHIELVVYSIIKKA